MSILTKTDRQFDVLFSDVLAEFIMDREAMGCRPRTIAWYQKNMDRFSAFLVANNIVAASVALSEQTIVGFLAYLQKQPPKNKHGEALLGRPLLSDRYIHGFARNLRTVARYAAQQHYIEKVPRIPMPKIQKKKLPVLEVEDAQKLLNTCSLTRDLLLVSLTIASGLRLGELTSLRWEDVDLRHGVIQVMEGKGGKYRAVVVDKDTLRLLIKYSIETRRFESDRIFLTNEGTPLTVLGIRSIFVRLSKKSGISFSAHALRRTFAKLAVKNGLDIVWIQQLMGHANIETTRDYIQGLDLSDLQKAYHDHAPLTGLLRIKK